MLPNLPPVLLKIALICRACNFIAVFMPLNMLLKSLLAHSGGRSIILLILSYRLDILYRESDCEVLCKGKKNLSILGVVY